MFSPIIGLIVPNVCAASGVIGRPLEKPLLVVASTPQSDFVGSIKSVRNELEQFEASRKMQSSPSPPLWPSCLCPNEAQSRLNSALSRENRKSNFFHVCLCMLLMSSCRFAAALVLMPETRCVAGLALASTQFSRAKRDNVAVVAV